MNTKYTARSRRSIASKKTFFKGENSRGDGQEENIDFHSHGHFEEKEPEQSNKFESPIRETKRNKGKKSSRNRPVPSKAMRGACDCKNKCLIKINECRRTAIPSTVLEERLGRKTKLDNECDQGTSHQEKTSKKTKWTRKENKLQVYFHE